jgi:lauroyl/myristoyl acyltransferase
MSDQVQHAADGTARTRRAAAVITEVGKWGAATLTVGAGQLLRCVTPAHRYRVADTLSGLLAPLLLRRNPLISENCARVLGVPPGAPEARALACATMRNFGRMAIDFVVSSAMPPAEILACVEALYTERFAAAHALGRGVILALPHLGSWDMAASFASARGLQLTVVTRDDWMAAVVEAVRRQRGVRIVREGRSARPLFQALRAGECLAILCDVEQRRGATVMAPFFGGPAPFPRGPARLAVSTGAPIVVVACVRQGQSGYRLEVHQPLVPDRTAPRDLEVARLTAALAREFEACIRRSPAQWYPFHTIWPEPPDLQQGR